MEEPGFPQSRGAMPQTIPGLVIAARSKEADGDEAVGLLYERYLLPCLAYLRYQFQKSPEDAWDLFQAFVVKKFVHTRAVPEAWDEIRPFRTLLLSSLKHFVIDIDKKRTTPIERVDPDKWENFPEPSDNPALRQFQVIEAVGVIARALDRVREEFSTKGKEMTWKVYWARDWQPMLDGESPPSLQELADQFRLAPWTRAANMVAKGREKLEQALRAAVVAEGEGPEKIDERIRELHLTLDAAPRQVLAELDAIQKFAESRVDTICRTPNVSHSISALLQSEPQRLANLLDLGSKNRQVWNDAELRALLTERITASAPFDLESLPTAEQGQFHSLAAMHGLALKNLKELFEHPSPPLELLQFLKHFAKAHLLHPDSPMPAPIARVLYYGAVACALVRHQTRISVADGTNLKEWFEWGRSQPWSDAILTSLFSDGLQSLNTRANC